MKKNKRAALAIIGFVMLFVLAGCAGKLGYGSVKLAALEGDQMTIDDLLENLKDYDVYFSGLDSRQPYGILFDKKGDDRKITSQFWYKLEDERAVSEMVQWMNSFYRSGPRLFRVRGADNQFYGYAFSAWTFIVLKQVDSNPLFAYDMKKIDSPRFRDAI